MKRALISKEVMPGELEIVDGPKVGLNFADFLRNNKVEVLEEGDNEFLLCSKTFTKPDESFLCRREFPYGTFIFWVLKDKVKIITPLKILLGWIKLPKEKKEAIRTSITS